MSYPLFINIAKVWVHKHFMPPPLPPPPNVLFLPSCFMPNAWYDTNPILLKVHPISPAKFAVSISQTYLPLKDKTSINRSFLNSWYLNRGVKPSSFLIVFSFSIMLFIVLLSAVLSEGKFSDFLFFKFCSSFFCNSFFRLSSLHINLISNWVAFPIFIWFYCFQKLVMFIKLFYNRFIFKNFE